MTTKELKQLLTENRNVRVKLNEWELVRRLDSSAGTDVNVYNNYRSEKSEFFTDTKEAIKFFMSKVSHHKSFLKRKNIPLDSFELEINLH